MKKIISLLFILSSLFTFVNKTNASADTGYFVVTAYYSPLANQKKYLTGDYESEKRLNGEGIRGASGKEVFSGMLAAPKTYSFGTKIYLEGLGIGEVADRGGAIVSAGNRGYSHDRIDVWVGYGDEGLQRALYWGKRTIKGYIVDSTTNVDLNYYNLPSPAWATNGLNSTPKLFTFGLGKGSDQSLVKELQEILKEVGLYDGEINGIYNNEIIEIIYNFQLENDLIEKGETYGAGYWGKTTRSLFLKKYLNGDFGDDEEIIEEEVVVEEKINDINIFDFPAVSISEVIRLQEILKEIGLYDGELTGKYDNPTINAIFNYQVKTGILSSEYQAGAGTYGPKTRENLKNDYTEFLERQRERELEELKKEQERIKAEERKKELEEKYKHLEELSLNKAEEKIEIIEYTKFGEVSHAVRELQIVLKKLGYFDLKDTAIFGNQTKQSLISYQLDKNIISSETEIGAGIVGPQTIESIKNDLKEIYLKDYALENNIDIEEIALIDNNL